MRRGLSLLPKRCAAVVVVVGLCLRGPAGMAQGIGGIDPADNGAPAPTGGPLPDPAGPGQDQAPPDPDSGKADKLEPPPSLPGSHAAPTAVAPLDKTATDMNPTAALFDAINRGDTIAARDALSRGADPEARNVLGLTPIDESVDLGRNDISFLLLSMRTSSATMTSSPGVSSTPGKRTAPIRSLAHGGSPDVAGPNAKPAIVATGVAVPSAGFLGFGGGS